MLRGGRGHGTCRGYLSQWHVLTTVWTGGRNLVINRGGRNQGTRGGYLSYRHALTITWAGGRNLLGGGGGGVYQRRVHTPVAPGAQSRTGHGCPGGAKSGPLEYRVRQGHAKREHKVLQRAADTPSGLCGAGTPSQSPSRQWGPRSWRSPAPAAGPRRTIEPTRGSRTSLATAPPQAWAGATALAQRQP